MKTSKLLYLLILVFAFCSSCESNDPEVTPKPDPIEEETLLEGNEWYYEPVIIKREVFNNSITLEAPKEMIESGKIYVKDQLLFINDVNKGFHIYNNSDASNPQKVGFLNAPGSSDMAIRGTTLYLNQSVDLVSITVDIDNISFVTTKRIQNTFPINRFGPNGSYYYEELLDDEVIVDWERKQRPIPETIWERCPECLIDTPIALENSDSSNDGQGGSLARFALKGEYLYTVDEEGLNVFDIKNTSNPVKVNDIAIGWAIETIYGFKDYLYIGSQFGMFIYGLENPEFPNQLAEVNHLTACDPVIANDNYAFVTLHSNRFCGNNVNLLEIYDVKDVTNPILVSERGLTAPKGIGLYHDYLIVCDDEIKIFDVSDPTNSSLVNSFNRAAFDVIIRGDQMIAIGDQQINQFSLSLDGEKGVKLEELSELLFE